jgi:hypothetical protein
MDVDALLKSIPLGAILGVLGYIGGIFTKPLTERITTWDERKRLRKSLYNELGGNLERLFFYFLKLGGIGPPDSYPAIDRWLRKEAYNEALKQAVLFNTLKESAFFSDFYMAVEEIKNRPDEKQRDPILSITGGWLKSQISAKRISRRQLRKSLRGTLYSRGSLNTSLFARPLEGWLTKQYHRLIWRNVQKPIQDQGVTYMPPSTLFERMKAIWRGIPSKEITFAALYAQLEQQRNPRK